MTKAIGKLGAQLGLLMMLLGGCSATTTIDEYRPTDQPIVINSDEKVVILGRRDAGHYETDREFIECVADKVINGDIKVLPEQQFIDGSEFIDGSGLLWQQWYSAASPEEQNKGETFTVRIYSLGKVYPYHHE